MPATVTYRRPARKVNDGYDGFLYLEHFGTGYQELVFSSHEAAQKYAASQVDCKYINVQVDSSEQA
jgi:hypothetical protein